ncbi:hypothetical protein B5180_33855 [Streptomyces sp. BF-3]|nr:hypothetical protein B5180_33855 [Streptomyces sp. BF-3]
MGPAARTGREPVRVRAARHTPRGDPRHADGRPHPAAGPPPRAPRRRGGGAGPAGPAHPGADGPAHGGGPPPHGRCGRIPRPGRRGGRRATRPGSGCVGAGRVE